MERIKQVRNFPVQIGGEPHSGWLPKSAAVPSPTLIRNYLIDVEILFDGDGYLLCYKSDDNEYRGDSWFDGIATAEQAAFEWFGIEPTDWVDYRASNEY